ncbi:DUF885 domain-containing protein [Nesterenkonia populi]|uniref:DUF885 domain-containing protein n=1 Tax=Nesterenkonia populi TaxID=1591087 RepID=UPI0011BF1242|nr:DUF885 domain-containing protein [Nesterenkonia populi]
MTFSLSGETPRQLADSFVHALAGLDPATAAELGLHLSDPRMPDFSPEAAERQAELCRQTLARLNELEAEAGSFDVAEQRCAVLLRDRLGVELEAHLAGEHLRPLRNIASPVDEARGVLLLVPSETEADWRVIGQRLSGLTASYSSLVRSLEEGRRQGLFAAPLQVRTVIEQLNAWLDEHEGAPTWFHEFVAEAPGSVQEELTAAADAAAAAVADLRAYLSETCLPASEGTPDAVGRERYLLNARRWVGSSIDPEEVYAWGWGEYRRIRAEMEELAEQIKPGSTPVEAMRWLEDHGRRVEGVEEVRVWLQEMMDRAIAELEGTHFDIAEPIRRVEAMIAPAGSAAAPYYTTPSLDFSRPGRTWLPTLGRTDFPIYDLVSTWYHEGVPGHHLQLAQWVYVKEQLSVFQTTVGASSGTMEGWALYAERLMDELGRLDAEERMGYLDAQMLRAVRVVIDLGMHLELTIPEDSPVSPGETWTPERAGELLAMNSGSPQEFIDSEIIRYLGWPAQAISYKLGERAWLSGRAAAQHARGESFDLKDWHMKALSLGALGLDDLEAELARL